MSITLDEVNVTASAGLKTFTRKSQPEDRASQYTETSFLISQKLIDLQTASIVAIDSVNSNGSVNVINLVNLSCSDGSYKPHEKLFNLPRFQWQGGANGIIIPPAPGDIGLAVFCSRDISKVKATKAAANPGSSRTHDYSDGVYFGGLLNQTATQFIEFLTGSISITSPLVTTSSVFQAGNGWSGSFATGDGKTVTVSHGIITGVA